MFGAAAMSLSSFCVVSNALRLNLFPVRSARKDKPLKHPVTADAVAADTTINNEKENTSMTKTMKIEGMMCGHCEAAVKKALEALPQVAEAAVSHENGTAVVTLNEAVTDEVLKKAVEDQDYTVVEIQ